MKLTIKKTAALLFALSLSSTSSYAFFCPKNFNQINFGDSIKTVEGQCGKPDKIAKKAGPDNTPQEWNYYIAQSNRGTHVPKEERGSLKTSFTFNGKGELVNINVNNVGVGTSHGCGSSISLGATREQVESACGKPEFVNKQKKESPSSGGTTGGKEDDKDKTIEYTYNSNPPVTLIFEEGKLTKKR